MSRKTAKLTAVAVKNLKEAGLFADGGGLYLQVTGKGGKSWIFRFMLNGRRRDMGLGSVQIVSLSEAREKAIECRRLVHLGQDPIEVRKSARLGLRTIPSMTYRECALAYIKAHKKGWKSTKHTQQWENTHLTYVFPIIGKLSITDIDTAWVMKVLEPIWDTKTETANRVRGRMEAVLDWATARKYRSGENPARWRGHLDQLLPAKSKVSRPSHHAALPYDQISTFLALLKDQNGVAARALEFTILTAARTSEVLSATWDDFDLEKQIWTIPAERMKAGKIHRVPSSDAALAVLERARGNSKDRFCFPGGNGNAPLSRCLVPSCDGADFL